MSVAPQDLNYRDVFIACDLDTYTVAGKAQ